jgi:protocatechuate 3,4-dioxygenase beta subunit
MFGESIASEGVGEHMFVEGRVLTTDGKPIPGAVVETWETDGEGELAFFDVSMFSRLMMDRHAFPKPLGVYDMQYAERTAPECRGRLRTDGEGKYGYRAIVPVSYAIPGDVSGNSSTVAALVTVVDIVGPSMSAACILGTTQRPAESLTRDDICARLPQAHYSVVSRRRSVPLKRCRQWGEEISRRGK